MPPLFGFVLVNWSREGTNAWEKSLEKVATCEENSLEKVEKTRKSPLKKLIFTSIISINQFCRRGVC